MLYYIILLMTMMMLTITIKTMQMTYDLCEVSRPEMARTVGYVTASPSQALNI